MDIPPASYPLLETIASPADLRKLPAAKLTDPERPAAKPARALKPKPIKGKAKVKAIKSGALAPKAKPKSVKPTGKARAKPRPKSRTAKRQSTKKTRR